MKEKLQYFILQPVMIVLLVVLDQLTKVWARANLIPNKKTLIDGVFSLTYLENRGSVWGIFQGKINFLLVITVIIFAIILYVYIKLPRTKQYSLLTWICAIMMAGAVGNTIDRVFMGYVTDFFYFELINFPIFNVADIYITVTAFLTIILVVTKYKNDNFDFLSIKKKQEKTDTDDVSEVVSETDNDN